MNGLNVYNETQSAAPDKKNSVVFDQAFFTYKYKKLFFGMVDGKYQPHPGKNEVNNKDLADLFHMSTSDLESELKSALERVHSSQA